MLVLGLLGGTYLSLSLQGEKPRGLGQPRRAIMDGTNEMARPVDAAGGLRSVAESRRLASLTKTMQRARDIGLSLNAPMSFYGKIIDQYGKPVSGVSAEFQSIYYNDIVLATYEPHKKKETRVSDANGEYSYSGQNGVTLSVSLLPQRGLRYEKFGSWSHSFQSNNGPSVKIPPTSKDKPFIFHVYRLANPVAVRTAFVEGYIAADKQTYGVSLSKEKLVESGAGDFDVTVWQQGIEYKKGRSWGIDLHGTHLQIAPTDDPFLYWASLEGYQPVWNYSCSDDLEDYRDERNFRFWIKQGEFFGSLSVECVAFWKDKFRLIVRSSINEKPGDPNLQPVLPDWPPKDMAVKK